MTAAVVVHRLPGRTRLRVRGRRGDPAFMERARAALAALPGVDEVRGRADTGSLLLRHRRDFSLEAVLRDDPGAVPFDLAEGAPGAGPEVRVLDRLVARLPGERPEPRMVLITVVLALALVQAWRGQLLGSASSLLWYAFQLAGGPPAPADIPEDGGAD